MQASGDVRETSVANADKIEIDLEKIILMIERQENVVPTLVLEEKNTNEDVEPHAQIDGGDILNFLYNLLVCAPFLRHKCVCVKEEKQIFF